MSTIKRYAKAVVAFLAPALTGLAGALTDVLSTRQFVFTLAGGALTCIVVWATPNTD